MNFDIFVLPFSIGLLALAGILLYKYAGWVKELDSAEKEKIKKGRVKKLKFSEFMQMVESKQIESAYIDGNVVTGEMSAIRTTKAKKYETAIPIDYPEFIPILRKNIAALYDGATEDNILVTGGAIEANYNATLTLLNKGDELVFMLPNYMKIIEKSTTKQILIYLFITATILISIGVYPSIKKELPLALQHPDCYLGGGKWEMLGSSCLDECPNDWPLMHTCALTFTYGCDCGPEKCWNGKKCIPNKY